ncbi:FecR domain-containing protein [Solitalea sp. MAHUQ-68]|uniref:FecR domain-containing protein n=1 Tax=Solitalea agri TaxID=2953739 RepID=A0A9X2F4K7_9SPHI|nr:FecR family protein [Solitalea agri]MCO4294050.1 FecR domain-containing protein [Solitalea agri]
MKIKQDNFKGEKWILDVLDDQSSEEHVFPTSDLEILEREKEILDDAILHAQFADKIDETADWQKVLGQPRIITLKSFLKYAAILAIPLIIGAAFFLTQKHSKLSLTATSTVQPGKKVMLILQDGSNVDLTQAKNVKGLSGVINNNSTLDYTNTENSSNADKPVFNTLLVPRGEDYKLVLEDGTEVWVNADTKIKYQVNLSKTQTREVYLEEGEAYFHVTKNPSKPFIVHNNNMAVQVLGTSFNVNAYSNTILTTLVEGKVKVSAGSDKFLFLTPGEQASFTSANGNLQKQDVDVYPFVSWKDGLIIVENETMSELMEKIGRLYDYDIQIKDEEIKNWHYSILAKRSSSVEDILNTIQSTSKLKFTVKERKIFVEKAINN